MLHPINFIQEPATKASAYRCTELPQLRGLRQSRAQPAPSPDLTQALSYHVFRLLRGMSDKVGQNTSDGFTAVLEDGISLLRAVPLE